MFKKKGIYLFIIVLVFIVAGCGKKQGGAGDEAEKSAQETVAADDPQSGSDVQTGENGGAADTENATETTEEPQAEEVFNNGGTFVKVGTKVYYRQYGADAYTRAELFGNFINGMPNGQECFIMCYDEAAGGEAVEVMEDKGFGPLVYVDGMLFSSYNIDYNEYYVYALDLEEKTSEKVCDGQIRYVDQETGRFVAVQERSDTVYFSVCRGKEVLDSFSVKNIQSFREICLQGECLVYRASDSSMTNPEGMDQLLVRNIKDKTELCLGDIPDVEDAESYYGKDLDQLVIYEDTVYAAVGFYAGTGYFYQDGYLCKASLKQENRLERIDWDSLTAVSWAEPYEAVTVLESALPELIRTDRQLYSVSEKYDTEYIDVVLPDETGKEPVIKEVVQVKGMSGEDASVLIERKEYVGGAIYMILDDVAYNEAESVGWRPAYDCEKVRYVCVDVETGMMSDIQPPVTMENGSYNEGSEVVSYYIENPAVGESYGVSDRVVEPIIFTEISRDELDWIDEDRWLAENNFSREDLYCPGYSFGLNDAYDRNTRRGYCLMVYSEEPGGTSYEIDLSGFYDPDPLFLEEQYRDAGWPAEYQYAYVENNVLYVAMYHMTYAGCMPYNAYILAIDLADGTLLWKSRPLTCNSRDFLVMDDVIICGYGFTAEDDYLYQLSKYTGEIVQTTKLRSKAYYIFYRNEHLYVQTYNTSYEYTR